MYAVHPFGYNTLLWFIITHATYIPKYFPIEFSCVDTNAHMHAYSKRIWISLRFIHTEIYFSKDAPEICTLYKRRMKASNTDRHEHKCDRKYEHEKPVRKLTKCSSYPPEPWMCTHLVEYWFQTASNHERKKWNLFILRQALSVISIKRLQIHSNERARCVSVYTSWFYLIFIFAIFHHTHALIHVYLFPWPSEFEWHQCSAQSNGAKYHRSLIYDVEDGKYILIYYIWIPNGHWNSPQTVSSAHKTILTVVHPNSTDIQILLSISCMNSEWFWIEKITFQSNSSFDLEASCICVTSTCALSM